MQYATNLVSNLNIQNKSLALCVFFSFFRFKHQNQTVPQCCAAPDFAWLSLGFAWPDVSQSVSQSINILFAGKIVVAAVVVLRIFSCVASERTRS